MRSNHDKIAVVAASRDDSAPDKAGNGTNKQFDNHPALSRFLQFLAADMTAHPDRLRSLDPEFVKRMKSLTEGVEFSLAAPLDSANE